MKRMYIDRSVGKLERTDLCLVTLTLADGTVYEDLQPRRLFPFTNPTCYISLLNVEGHEVAMVRDVDELDDASKAALSRSLKEFYRIPVIQKMLATEDVNGSITWRVLTDHGTVEFRIRNRNSDIKRLRGTRQVMIRDENDNRYLIPDYTGLDRHSQHLLYSYL